MPKFFEKNALEIFESSVHLSSQAIYWLDKEGRLLFANDNALTNLGYSLEEIQKLYVWDVDAIVNTKEKYLEAIKSFEIYGPDGLPNVIETKHKRKNGEIFPVEVISKFKTIDDQEYLISYVRDITDRLKRTEDINFYFELINSSRDMIFLVEHSNKKIEFVNDTACEVLGYSLEELKNMEVSDFRKPFESIDNINISEVFRRIEEENDMITFGIYTTKGGEEIFVETSVHLKEYHDKKYIVAISRDIKERVEVEAQKDELNRKLKAYNDTLKEEVEKAKNELMEYETIMRKQSRMAAMGEMIENIAHQWRQPLSAVSMLSTGMILQNSSNVLDKRSFDDSLNKINDHIQYLSKTIDDFRNFFKPDKEKNYFDIEELLKNAVTLSEARYNDININFEIKVHKKQELYSYESELLQVILNIINNAVDELRKVEYKKCIIFETSDAIGYFSVKIIDNAGGISEEIIDRIFEPYFTTKHSYQGTGIGLYMSKNILNHMNGRIEIKNTNVEYESCTYKGACFEIKIPL